MRRLVILRFVQLKSRDQPAANQGLFSQVRVPEPPISLFVEGKGVVTKGNATLSFFLANNTFASVLHGATVPHPADNRTATTRLSRRAGAASGRLGPSLTSSDYISGVVRDALSNALRIGLPQSSAIKRSASAPGVAAAVSSSISWGTSGMPSSLQSIAGERAGSRSSGPTKAEPLGIEDPRGYRRSLTEGSLKDGAASAEGVTQGRAGSSEYLRNPRTPESLGAGEQVVGGDQAQGSQTRSPEGAGDGDHLFTLDLSVELVASNITFVPVSRDKPDVFRLAVTMHIVQGSLWHRVVDTTVGPLDESGLDFLIGLVGFLVEQEVNGDILANLVLPDVAHIKLVQPAVRAMDGSVRVMADVKYV